MRLEREVYPDKPIALLGCDLVRIHFVRQFYLPFERAVINFHRQNLQRRMFLAGRLGRLPLASDGQQSRLDRKLKPGLIHTRQIHADRNLPRAPIGIDGRCPGRWRREGRKLDLRHLKCNVAEAALQTSKLNSGYVCHSLIRFC